MSWSYIGNNQQVINEGNLFHVVGIGASFLVKKSSRVFFMQLIYQSNFKHLELLHYDKLYFVVILCKQSRVL